MRHQHDAGAVKKPTVLALFIFRGLATKNNFHAGAAEQALFGEDAAIVLGYDIAGNRETDALSGAQRICALAAVEHRAAHRGGDPRAIIFNQNMQMVVVGLPDGDFHKLKAVFTGVIEHIAHNLHKIILFTDKTDFRGDIQW